MEIRTFAETLLYGDDLACKLLDPGAPSHGGGGALTDQTPGPARTVPASPGRAPELALRGRPAPRFPAAAGLVDPTARGVALHFFANHELLALELMALMLLRFPEAPPAFRRTLVATIRDEQRHLAAYLDRMADHGVTLGDYGLSAFFWDALADARTPAAFTAGMGLTLEQANLDFALHFERAFAAVDDGQTARLLRQVRIDEIGHLRQGRRWFDVFTGANAAPADGAGAANAASGRVSGDRQRSADATLFDRWSAALQPPLTPARGRGVDFDVNGRRAAGLPPGFIERVRLARHSKGRPPVVHTCEPTCELQLAHGRPGLALPRPLQQLSRDLETLPVAWAHADDVVLVRAPPPLALQRAWATAGLAVPEFVVADLDTPHLPADHPLRTRQLGDLQPWGWSPDAAARLRPCVPQLAKPPSYVQARGKTGKSAGSRWWAAPDTLNAVLSPSRLALHRKTTWPTVLAAHLVAEAAKIGADDGDACPLPTVATTRRQALDAIDALRNLGHDAVLKAPLGTAGRGAIRVLRSDGPPDRGQRRWLDRCLGQQGEVLIMPWLDGVADVSVQLWVAPSGVVRVLGVTRFLTDRRGQYQGTVLGRPTAGLSAEGRAYWHGGGDKQRGVPARLHRLALRVGRTLAEAGFAGPAGVDALLYRAAAHLRLYPLLEVNPRRTLGHVGLALEKHMAPGRQGLLLLIGQRELRASGAASFVELLTRLRRRLPVSHGTGGATRKLARGVVPLADAERVAMSLPLWLVGRRGEVVAAVNAEVGDFLSIGG